MGKNKKEISKLYNCIIKHFSNSVDDWFALRKTNKDQKFQFISDEEPNCSVFKHYLHKERKLITVLTTLTIKLRLEVFDTGEASAKKKVIILKYGGVMSSMEDMMFEQYTHRADRRSLHKGTGKMLRHLVDKNFIK